MYERTNIIKISVDANIVNVYIILKFPLLASFIICTKFRNGMAAIIIFVLMFNMDEIIPGKKLINVIGVRELCASLNVFASDVIAMHNPLIRNEKVIIIRMVIIIV